MTRLFWTVLIGILLAPALARAQSDEVVYYHTDAIGSVRMVTDASGASLGRYDYTPFGQQWEVPETNPDVRQFAGKELDETGLNYFGARYYASRSGRFSTVDPVVPIEDALLDPQRWNRYSYVMNRPLVLTDPDGRCPLCYLSQLAQRVASIPAVQRAQQVAETQGARAWVALTRLFNTPAGQETVQTMGELATGAQAPAGLLPALSATRTTAFLEAAVAEGRGGVSAAGRALQSHASRAGSWLADLAQGGNAAANTAAARKALGEILQSGQVTTASHKVWGDVVYVRMSDGRGAVWSAKGEFITFLERYSPQ